jgi:predicted HicB family RNase H-like nuclease
MKTPVLIRVDPEVKAELEGRAKKAGVSINRLAVRLLSDVLGIPNRLEAEVQRIKRAA